MEAVPTFGASFIDPDLVIDKVYRIIWTNTKTGATDHAQVLVHLDGHRYLRSKGELPKCQAGRKVVLEEVYL